MSVRHRSLEEFMAYRYFENQMPQYIVKAKGKYAAAVDTSLLKLLSLSFPSAAERFLQAAINLKEKVL